MEFGIQVRQDTFDEYVRAAQWAEHHGLAAFAVPDHYSYGPGPDGRPTAAHDALTVMAGIARETSTIELVLLVSPATFRHPAVLAKTAATIDEIAGGRLLLGVGTGWQEEEHRRFGIPFPSLGERYEELEEQLAYLRAAADPSGPGFEGDRHRLAPGAVLPVGPRRLLVGGTGTRKTPTLAGRYADEFNAYPAPTEAYRDKLSLARREAETAGRDPDSLRISTSSVLVGGATTAAYRERLEPLAAIFKVDVDQVDSSTRERNAPCGTWDEWSEVLADYEAAGVERFYFQTIGGLDEAYVGEALAALS